MAIVMKPIVLSRIGGFDGKSGPAHIVFVGERCDVSVTFENDGRLMGNPPPARFRTTDEGVLALEWNAEEPTYATISGVAPGAARVVAECDSLGQTRELEMRVTSEPEIQHF
jgi:hypothetical protein